MARVSQLAQQSVRLRRPRLILENRSLAELNNLAAIVWRDVMRPLINISYAMDLRIWGPRPLGFHITNVLLHGVNVLWVFYLARALALDAGRRARDEVEPAASADADVVDRHCAAASLASDAERRRSATSAAAPSCCAQRCCCRPSWRRAASSSAAEPGGWLQRSRSGSRR